MAIHERCVKTYKGKRIMTDGRGWFWVKGSDGTMMHEPSIIECMEDIDADERYEQVQQYAGAWPL